MSQSIKNGSNGNVAKVDKKRRLHNFSVTYSTEEQATEDEGAFNINSGLITLTTAGESGLIYYKHNESDPFILKTIVVIMGPSTNGSATDTTHVRIYKNPTTGTLISDANAVSINSNRDYGSSESLSSSLAYKGATGKTITDGSTHIESLVSPGSRVPFGIGDLLRKGNSVAVSLEPNDSNTSMKCMVAFIGHLKVSTAE